MNKIIFLICFLLINSVYFAQSDANSILRELQNKYNSISDLSVDYSQRAGGKVILSGKIIFKKENKYRIENKNQIIGSDGNSAWNYNASQKKFVITNYDSGNNSIYSINYLVYQLPNECTLSARIESVTKVLELTPKTTNLQFRKIDLWINSDNLIQKIVLSDYNNNTNEINLSNYKLNQKISDSLFSFNPPEGTKVIDLR
ncbi:LolA family protein [Ignavibacterium album]|uniref:LolA family protein n=1 Tax=Ignavibacterium album TaxID=591197 RepID=UPI00059C7A91|nr:outer membrane lipoprotein carrier protein LolA [Ignavibacterium album]